ncbi:MAG: GTPase HflX [Planctomycetota bacterium]|nr:GTPase HflX [Planctomycetota bacterium]
MPPPQERSGIQVSAERAVLAAVRLPDSRYDVRDPFGELRSLAEQAGARVVGELSQNLAKPIPATFMGSGKISELKALCEELGATTIIFDHDLSPKQISNLEKETLRKVIDRSELILDIFASRASSAEAQLQVELAQLEYTYPRLKAMWSHLERITGGIGSRGPGEQQLEIDRRLVQSRRNDLEHEIRIVQDRKRREVQQRKQEHFTVGIVGYTNAGKSTLFNTLTAGGAYADDRVFATLMTRTRQWDLGGGLSVMLSDTVGFVRDLPHNLIAAFRATLEEATHADVLLIVLDVSDPSAELQYHTVTKTLDELLAEVAKGEEEQKRGWTPPSRILLLNKTDKLRDNAELLVWKQKVPSAIAISALPPRDAPVIEQVGLRELHDRIRSAAMGEIRDLFITVPLRDSRTISVIENRGQVSSREYTTDSVTLRARIGTRQLDQLRSAGAKMQIRPADGGLVPTIGPIGAIDPPRATPWEAQQT